MEKLTWLKVQKLSDEILSDGLYLLKNKPYKNFLDVTENSFGNYLISLNKKPFYIGEAKEISKRIKQQSKPTTSTFYKNYMKLAAGNLLLKKTKIDDFKVQHIITNIGRKEVEEFGIVNLPTKLNAFQLGKRKKFEISSQNGLWNMVQENSIKLLEDGEKRVLKSTYTPWFDTKIENYAGLYLVKDKSGEFIYIGESSNVGDRIITHSGKTYFSALRRHIGTDILKFNLKEIKGKKRYFSDLEDKKVTEFLKKCSLTLVPVSFGRFELEEYLIKKHRPLLNRKDNKS